jgi:LysM repeat protein
MQWFFAFSVNMTAELNNKKRRGTGWVRTALLLVMAGATDAGAQTPAVKPVIPPVEAGLEVAVTWKWRVEAGPLGPWAPVEEPAVEVRKAELLPSTPTGSAALPTATAAVTPAGPPLESLEHVVSRGEALAIIGRRYYVTVEQLKKANGLTSDKIIVGQKLKIPSLDEIKAMTPPPPAKPTVSVTVEAKDEKPEAPEPSAEEAVKKAPPARMKYTRALPGEAIRSGHIVLTQAYLDRQLFSAGPIDGGAGALYEATLAAYRAANPGVLDYVNGETPDALLQMGGAYREYALRAEDFRWIRGAAAATTASARGASSKDKTPDPTWNDLTQGQPLLYRSTWEFVAEKFHCSESFLRRINASLRNPSSIGAIYLVPNVEPFEIENAVEEPVQPAVDEAVPVVATVVNGIWLEVRKAGNLIARVPISAARPGLRGRGSWKILDAVLRPQLVSTGEWNSAPKAAVGGEEVVVLPPPEGLILPPGPNNPLGPIWLNLAKGNETTPLPYGLHGTSIPGYLTKQESLGGFRLANWDLVRIARLLPVGTELKWE